MKRRLRPWLAPRRGGYQATRVHVVDGAGPFSPTPPPGRAAASSADASLSAERALKRIVAMSTEDGDTLLLAQLVAFRGLHMSASSIESKFDNAGNPL